MTLHNLHDPTTSQSVWTLRGCTGNDERLECIPLTRFPCTVGRRPDSSVVLTSPQVSGCHAEFIAGGQTLFVRDLSSTNGTFVNGRRIESATPVVRGDRVQFADCEFAVESAASASHKDPFHGTLRTPIVQNQWAFSQFDQLMVGGVQAAYQDIVRVGTGEVHGVESLARSEIEGLKRPDQMFSAAKRVGQEVALSQLCRRVAANSCEQHVTPDQALFMNTHPAEDLFRHVLPSLVTLRDRWPHQRFVIEIHEESMTGVRQMQAFADELSALNVEFAYDDFGVGQNRLLELIEVPPHYIKFDRQLITGLERASHARLQLLRSFVETAHSTGTLTVAEGVEERSGEKICGDLGFDLIQGYLYGKPTSIPRR